MKIDMNSPETKRNNIKGNIAMANDTIADQQQLKSELPHLSMLFDKIIERERERITGYFAELAEMEH